MTKKPQKDAISMLRKAYAFECASPEKNPLCFEIKGGKVVRMFLKGIDGSDYMPTKGAKR